MNLLSSLLAFTARQIGALKTQADSNTSRVGATESNLSALTTRVNNTVVANSNSKEVLWTGSSVEGTITLSKAISNFDFIDIEYEQSGSGDTDNKTITKRIPAIAGSYVVNDFTLNYTNTLLNFYKQTITLGDTSLTAAQNYNVEASGGSNNWTKLRGTYSFTIVRVVGIKMGSASPAELTDIRLGADNTTYDSAGNAVRSQFTQLKSDLAVVYSGEDIFEISGSDIETRIPIDEYVKSAFTAYHSELTYYEGSTSFFVGAYNSNETLIQELVREKGSQNARTAEYTIPDGTSYLRLVCHSTSTASVTITTEKLSLKDINDSVSTLDSAVFYTEEKNIEWVTGFCMVGNFTTKSGDKVSKPFTLYKGETVSIKTKGDGSYLFTTISKVPSLDIPIAAGYSSGTRITWITTNSLTTYSHTADEDEYIVLGGLDDPTTTVEFSNLKTVTRFDVLQDEIDDIKDYSNGILRNKSVMFFGDSLTAASTTGVYGFAERIADEYGIPYKSFVSDSADGNPSDIPTDSVRFTNYAKDGTTNRNVSGRSDSVLQRVKRHITEDTLVDYVLIECCVNDMAQEYRNKGTISESYTATYDTDTSIGALEETLRYLTTLSNNIHIGGFIPWLISWEVDGWFDDYIAVFEKWGVPLFDMRNTSGFNLRYCGAHRQRYTLSADNYSAYDNTATYNLDDKVKYGGILYKCLSNGVTGKVPTDTTYWMEVSSESSDGTHLNSIGHYVVAGKIQKFIERC